MGNACSEPSRGQGYDHLRPTDYHPQQPYNHQPTTDWGNRGIPATFDVERAYSKYPQQSSPTFNVGQRGHISGSGVPASFDAYRSAQLDQNENVAFVSPRIGASPQRPQGSSSGGNEKQHADTRRPTRDDILASFDSKFHASVSEAFPTPFQSMPAQSNMQQFQSMPPQSNMQQRSSSISNQAPYDTRGAQLSARSLSARTAYDRSQGTTLDQVSQVPAAPANVRVPGRGQLI